MNTDIVEEFNAFSSGYTEKMERYVPHYLTMLDAITKYLPVDFEPKRILELGCGNGNVTALLLKKYPDANLTLVDASDEMLNICAQRFQSFSNLKYQENFFQELSWRPMSFDLVVAGISLHHLDAPAKKEIFPKIQGALDEKGIFACCDLFVEKDDEPFHSEVLKDWHQFMMDHKSTEEEWGWIMDHYDKYDRPNAFSRQKEWLTEAGFASSELSWNIGPWGCFHARV